MRTLSKAVDRVVRDGNCSGCGACTAICPLISMQRDGEGYLRPSTSALIEDVARNTREAARRFAKVCPGVGVVAPSDTRPFRSDVFGDYTAAFEGFATSDEIRHAGSSGGVLTAISDWLLASGDATSVRAVREGASTTSVSVTISNARGLIPTAGSRYAPVSTLDGLSVGDLPSVVVGKPCEISALSALASQSGIAARPLLLTFFCAGTPSQDATDNLVRSVGIAPADVSDLRYRGAGWPGSFQVRSTDGEEASMSYEDSWGQHLGRALQWRCKVCVDGTGVHGDISVGDYWATDDRGYPTFTASDGNSVVIARTQRGLETLRAAEHAGVISLVPLNLGLVEQIQPLQVQRKLTLFGRLAGAQIAGQRVPSYRGFRLAAIAMKGAKANIKAAGWTFLRVARKGKASA